MISATDLIGLAVARLSMSPTDVLIVFCPDEWSVEQVSMFDEWMTVLYPSINLMMLPGSASAAVIAGTPAEQLRIIETISCVPRSHLN